jgi:predicted phosphodiesterase
MKATSRNDIARALIEEYPSHSQRNLARILYKRHPLLFKDVDYARAAIRRATGSSADGSRVVEDYKKHSPGQESPPPLPRSKAKSWLPVSIEGRKALVLSDIHLPFHSLSALNGALRVGDEFAPDVILLNGDIIDFSAISKYETDPTKRDLAGELRALQTFLEHVRTRYRKARIVYKLGNHEERWWPYMWRKCPEFLGIEAVSFPALSGADNLGIEIVQEKRIVMLGKLPVLHGHELPRGLATPVNPARGAFLKALETVMVAHEHRTSEHPETTLLGRTITTWSTGCLSELHPQFRPINRWNHGAATVEIARNGDFSVRNFKIKNGRVL